MLTKCHSSLFALTVASVLSLSTTPTQSSEPTGQTSTKVPVSAEVMVANKCPVLNWSDLDAIISPNGFKSDRRIFVPINIEEFKKNMPRGYNIWTTGKSKPPQLTKTEYYLIPGTSSLEIHCFYEYHTLASGMQSVVKGSEGYKLGIKANTNQKVNKLEIRNNSTEPITVDVFPADSTGNPTATTTKIHYEVPKYQVIEKIFTIADNPGFFTIQAKYEGGGVSCGHTIGGGKSFLLISEASIKEVRGGKTCQLRHIGEY